MPTESLTGVISLTWTRILCPEKSSPDRRNPTRRTCNTANTQYPNASKTSCRHPENCIEACTGSRSCTHASLPRSSDSCAPLSRDPTLKSGGRPSAMPQVAARGAGIVRFLSAELQQPHVTLPAAVCEVILSLQALCDLLARLVATCAGQVAPRERSKIQRLGSATNLPSSLYPPCQNEWRGPGNGAIQPRLADPRGGCGWCGSSEYGVGVREPWCATAYGDRRKQTPSFRTRSDIYCIRHARSRKGYWHMAKTIASGVGLTNAWLARTRTVKHEDFLGRACSTSFNRRDAEPHVRWCGGRGGKPPRLPH